MKPAPFDYYAPTSAEEALEHLAQLGYDGKLLAGGQSLIPAMNFRLAQPAALIDLNNVSELFYIRPYDGGVVIGAMTRDSTVERDPLVAQRAPMVCAAMYHMAHPQIRNRGTVGGAIAHADPAGQMPAVSVALNGRCHIRSKTRERWVAADEFFVGLFTTVLEPDEMLVEIALPPMPPRSGWSYRQVARQSGAGALVGVATVVTLDDRKYCQHVRLAYLSVGEKPVMAQQAAGLLIGQPPTAEAIRAAAETARSELDPGRDIHASADFRRHLVGVLTRQALTEAFDRAGIPSLISNP